MIGKLGRGETAIKVDFFHGFYLSEQTVGEFVRMAVIPESAAKDAVLFIFGTYKKGKCANERFAVINLLFEMAGCPISDSELMMYIESIEDYGLYTYGFAMVAQKDEILKISKNENVSYICTAPLN